MDRLGLGLFAVLFAAFLAFAWRRGPIEHDDQAPAAGAAIAHGVPIWMMGRWQRRAI
jgi:hypothetical protein